MAFGKKGKQEEPAAAVDAADPPAGEDIDELSGEMFSAEEPSEEDDAITAGLLAEEKAEVAADPLGGGDLLNMFQTTQIEQEDLSTILDLAGEVELDDLLEDLHTIAAALGCRVNRDALAAA